MKFLKTFLILGLTSMTNSLTPHPKIPHSVSKIVIKKATAFLPAVDTIGHNVLNFNREAINYIIDNNYINLELKKSVILFLIELAEGGDMMGSLFLNIYHNLVYFLL